MVKQIHMDVDQYGYKYNKFSWTPIAQKMSPYPQNQRFSGFQENAAIKRMQFLCTPSRASQLMHVKSCSQLVLDSLDWQSQLRWEEKAKQMSWLCCFVRCIIVLILISTSLMTLGSLHVCLGFQIKNSIRHVWEWHILPPCASIVPFTKCFHFIAYTSWLLLTRYVQTYLQNRLVI